MSEDQNQPEHPSYRQWMPQSNLPNATAVLVLGICSIFPGCFCFGVVGIACGIICLVLAKKDLLLYQSNPGLYNPASYNNLKAGRICAIVGLCINSMLILCYIVYFIILGAAISLMPWKMWI